MSFLYVVTGENMVTGFPIGSWDFPSGNRVRVSLANGNGTGVRTLRCEWDRFPVSRRDRQQYQMVIGPEIYRRLQQYLEVPSANMLVVGLE